jgi:hypothetical protein
MSGSLDEPRMDGRTHLPEVVFAEGPADDGSDT